MKLSEVAELLGGRREGGDPGTDISGAAGLEDAGEGDITFLSDRKRLKAALNTGAACVLVSEFIPELDRPQLIVPDPHLCFIKLLERLYGKAPAPSGISDLAFVSEGASVGEGVSIGAFAYISAGAVIGKGTIVYPGVFIGENTVIGADCVIYPNVVIREGVKVGNRVIIHPGAVIGADGFGYIQRGGEHVKIPQVGSVVIGDDVEIGANTAVDRATTGATVIGRGTKIDNLVQVAHNVHVGEDSIIVAQVGIAGSSRIGSSVVLAGQAGVADHTTVEDGTMIGAQAGVFGRISKGVYSGYPAMAHRDWLKASGLFARLPEMMKRIKALEEKISDLEKTKDEGGKDD